jgi:uroporphyrinogen decarboxylase
VTARNDLLLRALLRQPTERTPVWLMRQAGRYLPEYRATRARAGSFLKLCMTPELACEVTLQPLERYPLDAAILFSDILTIPHAMHLGLAFETGEGPRIARPVRCDGDIDRLFVPDPATDLRYVLDAVALIRRELAGRVPLIGFAGSPWTVATYVVEGGSSRSFAHIKTMLYDSPASLHRLLALLADATTLYLNAQIEAGVQAVMVFDTWGGVLTPAAYREFSLEYMQRVIAGLTREREDRRVPSILFTKGGGAWLDRIARTGCDALGVDWTTDLADARRAVENATALQGNLDPSVLYAGPATIREHVGNVLASYGQGHGHVFNLGHGIHPDVPPDHVAAMVAAVHELSPAYHRMNGAGAGTGDGRGQEPSGRPQGSAC